VGQAIAHLRPWGVDVSTGVESSPGVKDPAKLRDFIAAVRVAENQVAASTGAVGDPVPHATVRRRVRGETPDLFDWQNE